MSQFGQILICQNQKLLQIPDFMVYKAPDVQLTKIRYNSSVMDENSKGFQRFFLYNHVQWCCMRTEQYSQRSFVIPSTIIETTTAGKVN